MKKALSYIRISDEDQSNWSITGQSRMNEKFARSRGIDIIDTYVDDGVSAKDFNRPQWKRCEAMMKGRRDIDFLIISKYDRLIRNASQGLSMIEKLEDKYSIKVLSVQENFFIDPYSPYFFKMRADMLVTAEFERRVISDRTKFGIWSAKSQGRFIGTAPFGYKNAKDSNGKPIIVKVEEEALIVEKIFERYLEGDRLTQIKSYAKNIGFNKRGQSAITRILENPLYAGYIKVPSWKGNKSYLAEGVHEPIITKAVWDATQYRMGYKPDSPKKYREEVPLRGLIYCGDCGHICTGGRSRGKMKVYYWYYRCSNKDCNRHYNSSKVDSDISELMRVLSYNDDMLISIKEECVKQLHDRIAENSGALRKFSDDLDKINKKLISLEDKFLSDMITAETYHRWLKDLSEQKYSLESRIAELSIHLDDKLARLDERLSLIRSLGDVYVNSSPRDKYRLLKGCSKYGFMYTPEVIRTPELNPVFDYIDLRDSKLQICEDLIKRGEMKVRPVGTPDGTIYQTLFVHLKRLIT